MRSQRLKNIIASEEDKFWKVLSKNTNLSEDLINLDKRLEKHNNNKGAKSTKGYKWILIYKKKINYFSCNRNTYTINF